MLQILSDERTYAYDQHGVWWKYCGNSKPPHYHAALTVNSRCLILNCAPWRVLNCVWWMSSTLQSWWSCMCPANERAGQSPPHHTLWCSCKWRILGRSCQSPLWHSECSQRWKTSRSRLVTQRNNMHSSELYTSINNLTQRHLDRSVGIVGSKNKHQLVFL